MDNTNESSWIKRQKDLAEMVVARWHNLHYGSGFHLEQYDENKLYPLLVSRMRKLTAQMQAGKLQPPEHLRTENLDEVFQSILDAGLLTPVNPKIISEKEKREAELEARKEAARKEGYANADLRVFIIQLEAQQGQRGVSEWYFKRATKEQKRRFNEIFPAGAVTPETSAHQSNLFVIRATFNDGRVKFVSGDVNPVPLDSTAAHRFGRTNAERYAEALAAQRAGLKIEIIPADQPQPTVEATDEYIRQLIQEQFHKSRPAQTKPNART